MFKSQTLPNASETKSLKQSLLIHLPHYEELARQLWSNSNAAGRTPRMDQGRFADHFVMSLARLLDVGADSPGFRARINLLREELFGQNPPTEFELSTWFGVVDANLKVILPAVECCAWIKFLSLILSDHIE